MNITGKISSERVSNEIIRLDQTFFPTPWTDRQWQDLAHETHTLLCWREGEVLKGFCLLWTLEGDNVAHLLKILLLEETRGTESSTKFWGGICDDLKKKGFQSVYLEVEAGNRRAQAFYEKVGFKAVRRNKAYYSSGEDALIMTLTL